MASPIVRKGCNRIPKKIMLPWRLHGSLNAVSHIHGLGWYSMFGTLKKLMVGRLVWECIFNSPFFSLAFSKHNPMD